jgi:predicted nucleic acid-binding protein
MSLVIDASVATKYLLPEADTDKARAVFKEWQGGRVDLLAPDILPAEVANALWKRALRGLASRDEVERLFEQYSGMRIPLTPADDLAGSALRLALTHRHSVYDGLYLALALETGWDFLTADERLFNLLSAAFPQVRLLRDWS